MVVTSVVVLPQRIFDMVARLNYFNGASWPCSASSDPALFSIQDRGYDPNIITHAHGAGTISVGGLGAGTIQGRKYTGI